MCVSFGWFAVLSFADPTAEPLVTETVSGVAEEEGGVELAIAREAAQAEPAVPGGTRVRLITCVSAGSSLKGRGCADRRVREAREHAQTGRTHSA